MEVVGEGEGEVEGGGEGEMEGKLCKSCSITILSSKNQRWLREVTCISSTQIYGPLIIIWLAI